MNPREAITIELSSDEALVLFDLLADYGKVDRTQLTVRNAAEQNVLWALSAALERQLVVPFDPDYSQQLAAARRRVEEEGGSW